MFVEVKTIEAIIQKKNMMADQDLSILRRRRWAGYEYVFGSV